MALETADSVSRNGSPVSVSRIARRLKWELQKYSCIALGRKAIRSQFGIWLTPNWNDKTFRYCVRADTYGRFYADYLARLGRTFMMIDVGANQGLYSILAAQNEHCRRVVCYEPVPATYELLLRNIELNQSRSEVITVNAALSHRQGKAAINTKKRHSGVASLSVLPGSTSTEKVLTLPADSVEQHLLPETPVVLKVDTEGHEEVILTSLFRAGILRRVVSIFYEVDERRADPAMKGVLRDAGFRRFEKVGGGIHYDVLATR